MSCDQWGGMWVREVGLEAWRSLGAGAREGAEKLVRHVVGSLS
jgi:hypothetical protein